MPSTAVKIESGEQLSRVAEHLSMHMPPSQADMFSGLPERRAPWKEFVCSLGTQSLLLFLVAWVGVLHLEILIPPTHDLHFIGLVNNPPPVPQQPAPVKLLKQPMMHVEARS